MIVKVELILSWEMEGSEILEGYLVHRYNFEHLFPFIVSNSHLKGCVSHKHMGGVRGGWALKSLALKTVTQLGAGKCWGLSLKVAKAFLKGMRKTH